MKALMISLQFLFLTLNLNALTDGNYIYSFTRVTDFPEVETMYRDMGLSYRTVSVEKITGIVVNIKNGSFTDPTIQLNLAVDKSGKISSPDSDTISGKRNQKGNLSWSGFRDHFGQKARMVVTGSLIPINNSDKAGSLLDGTYLLEEEIGGQKMAARISNGFLTFETLSGSDTETVKSGWPLLVTKTGEIYSVYEFITRVEVNGIAGDSSTFLTTEGKASSGALSLVLQNSTATSTDAPGSSARRVYGGQQIHEADLGQVKPESTGQTLARKDYPDWFINPDNGPDWLAASGCKRMEDKTAALKAAETMAAANLALQIQAQVKTSVILWSRTTESGGMFKEEAQLETATDQVAYLPLVYKVLKTYYDEKTKTAWVMIGITKSEAAKTVEESFLKLFDEKTSREALDTAF